MAKDFDFTEEVRGLKVPTLIVAADADMAPPSHYVEMFKLLDGGLRDGGWKGEGRPKGGHALAILPGLTHYNLGPRRCSRTRSLASSTRRTRRVPATQTEGEATELQQHPDRVGGSAAARRLLHEAVRRRRRCSRRVHGLADRVGLRHGRAAQRGHRQERPPGPDHLEHRDAGRQGRLRALQGRRRDRRRRAVRLRRRSKLSIATLADPDDNYFQLMSPMGPTPADSIDDRGAVGSAHRCGRLEDRFDPGGPGPAVFVCPAALGRSRHP